MVREVPKAVARRNMFLKWWISWGFGGRSFHWVALKMSTESK